MRHVFISHSSSDGELAAHVATYLERRGIACWYTPRDVDPAQDWDQAILEAIEESSAMLLLFSGSADGSRHVRREVHLADNAKKFLLTLRIEDVQPDRLSYFLNLSQWIDWMDRRDDALERVYAALKGLDGGVSSDHSSASKARAQTVSIPAGQKLWLRPSSREFVPAPNFPREERVLTSDTDSPHAVGYLRMRAVGNGRYDKYHEVKRADGSLYGYFTDGFSQVAYTYGFVSPTDDDCIYVLNHGYRASKSTLSIIRSSGTVWLKMAPKFAVVKALPLAFEISSGEITHFGFLDEYQRKLFCLNGAGFFTFDTSRQEFTANIEFDQTWLNENAYAVSPAAPLIAVAISRFLRKGALDNREIYQATVEIYHAENGQRMMSFELPGDDYKNWKVQFGMGGNMIKASTDGTDHLFDLIEVG